MATYIEEAMKALHWVHCGDACTRTEYMMYEKSTSLQEDLKAQWKTMFIQIVLIDVKVFKTIAEHDECTEIHDIWELSEEIKKQILFIAFYWYIFFISFFTARLSFFTD